MKKLIWRLREQPTSKSLQELVNSGILTKEEARKILFSSETIEDRDKRSLESEIKFLRELVEKLSNKDNSRVVEIIREVEKPYHPYPWYQQYSIWCGTTDEANSVCLTASGSTGTTVTTSQNFSDIKTF